MGNRVVLPSPYFTLGLDGACGLYYYHTSLCRIHNLGRLKERRGVSESPLSHSVQSDHHRGAERAVATVKKTAGAVVSSRQGACRGGRLSVLRAIENSVALPCVETSQCTQLCTDHNAMGLPLHLFIGVSDVKKVERFVISFSVAEFLRI
ncbi:hypothetical protein J6590_006538 [Homalodisca vitripennis]|nr:hypothetical protein J6590_006538 [Homalodisca vitripennis]